jgi:heat shock protein HslJ
VNRVVIAIGLLLAALVAGCGGGAPTPSEEPVELRGTNWRAVTIAGQPVIPGAEPTVSFTGDRISGTDGCNQYGGSVRAEGSGFATGDLGQTLMLCDDRVMAVATPFLAILRDVDRVAVADGRLLLSGPAGDAVFVPAAAP